MGPRFCKRGNLLDRDRAGVHLTLLQWGHAFVSVETVSVPHAAREVRRSFNGATLL